MDKSAPPPFRGRLRIIKRRTFLFRPIEYRCADSLRPGPAGGSRVWHPGHYRCYGSKFDRGNDTAKELVDRFTFRDQLSWTRGRHSLQLGMEVVRHYIDATIPIVNGGNVVYDGSRANHLFIGQETNPCLPTQVLPSGTVVRNYGLNPAACPPVNPNLSNIVDRFAVGTSNYNSLQVALDRGFGRNVQFRSAYTYSKCMDYGSNYTGNDSIGPNGQTAGLQAGNLANVYHNVDYGPCDFDLRHNWTSNIIVQLPFSGNRLKAGWQLSLISSIHSGTPYSVYDGFDRADVGASGAAANAERPDLVAGASNNPTGVHVTTAGVVGFNPSAFQPQAVGVFGDLGRNTLTAPGVREVDFSLAKSTKITESTNAQLRLDVFNLANHTNFGFPNADLYTGYGPTGAVLGNGAAGQITSTATTSRQLQLSVKFTF